VPTSKDPLSSSQTTAGTCASIAQANHGNSGLSDCVHFARAIGKVSPMSMTWNNVSISILAGLTCATNVAAATCSASSGTLVRPLVELYTSEGCSSCPPADRWLSAQLGRADINLLAFHVDYWDDIGWPDRFASPLFSQRQRQRVNAAGSDSVYTPQVMVGTDVGATWRSTSSFARSVNADASSAQVSIRLSIEQQETHLRASLDISAADDVDSHAQVWLAQYLDGQISQVRAGENRGATLHHDRVVHKLWGPWSLPAIAAGHSQSIVPHDGTWGLVAIVQGRAGNTLQSLRLPASECDLTSR
jgi:hypothetical protein